MKSTPFALGLTLVIGGMGLTSAAAATAPSKALTAARERMAKLEAKAAAIGEVTRNAREEQDFTQNVLLKNLEKQLISLETVQSQIATARSKNNTRDVINDLCTAADKGGTVMALATGGLGVGIKEYAKGLVQDAAKNYILGDDPFDLEYKALDGIRLETNTQQKGAKIPLQEVQRLLTMTPAEIVGNAKDPAYIPSILIWTSAEERKYREHADKVDTAVKYAREALGGLRKKLADNLDKYENVIRKGIEDHDALKIEMAAAQAEKDKLESAEKAKIVEAAVAAVVALAPPPPPPPPLPDPPPPEPEQTPLERYIEYYEIGLGELAYYLPGWIGAAKARAAEISGLWGELGHVLAVNGVTGGATMSLDYVQYALKPTEPAAATEGLSLADLAQRHRFYQPAATFYMASRVYGAINDGEMILQRIKSATIALEDLKNKIMSMREYAESMDAFFEIFGAGTGDPPSDLSVVWAFDHWPGLDVLSSGSTLPGVGQTMADLDYRSGQAFDLIRKLNGSLAAIEVEFANRVAAMVADLQELKPALVAYRSAFLRVEKALANYQALADTSVLGLDRPSNLRVNYNNLDQVSRQDLTRTLDLWGLNLSGLTFDQIRGRIATAKQDILQAENYAAAYRAARRDLLVAWDSIARLYPQFKASEGAIRSEWTMAWDRQQSMEPNYYSLKVPAPDFVAVDAAPWSWVFSYQQGNPMLTAFNTLEDLPTPSLEALDDVLSVLTVVDQAAQYSVAWRQLPAAQVVPLLQQWQATQLAWARGRTANWTEIFGAWAASQVQFARNDILMSHAFVNGDPAAPVITRQPVGVKVAKGHSAELSIEVQGTLFSGDWYIYEPYAGSSYILRICPASCGQTFRTPPVTADTKFVCQLKWGKSPDANNQILLSDVITVSVDDGFNQSFNPVSIAVPKAGGAFEAQLTSTGPSGPLAWTSETSTSWVTAPAAGSGSGTLAIVVGSNTDDLERSARVTVGGAVLTVRQEASVEFPAGNPVFTTQPSNQTAQLSGAVNFTVATTGTAPIAYQWKKGSLNLTNGGRIAGATSATLQIANLQMSDAGTYSVVATNSVGSRVSNAISLTVTSATAAPANDAFASAASLGGATAQTTASNAGATKETNEPKHAGLTGGSSVWWRWTAPATGMVAIDTIGSNFDTALAIYTGTAVGGLTAVASDDEGGGGGSSAVKFKATAGTVYSIAVDGAGGASGIVQLHLAQAAAPANDDFANGQVITGNSGSATGNNTSATGESGEPAHVTAAGTASSIWYRWTATADGSLTVDTIGSNFDTVLAVYSGASVSALTRLAYDDGSGGTGSTSRLAFNITAGVTYHIAVGSFDSARGSVALHWLYSAAAAGTLSPVITTQPQAQSGLAGATVTFSVVASGTAPLTYQWKKDGAVLAESTHLAGVATASLKINGMQSADVGGYTVVVKNAAGEATSNVVALTLQVGGGVPPTVALTAPAQGAVFALGTGTTLTATAADADGTIASVKFLASGTSLGVDTTAPYSVSWQPPGPGVYSLTAVATDNHGNQTTSAAVKVSAGLPPAITLQPVAQTAALGASASFSVTASGTMLTYQWRRGGLPLANGTDERLSLAAVQATDAGDYDVVVSNGFGPAVTSNPARLTVTGAPTGYAANFDALTAGVTLDGQGTPAWSAIKLTNYVDPLVQAGDAAHTTNYVRGPVDWKTSGATQAVSPALEYPLGNYRAEWRCQIFVPEPTVSYGNTVAALRISGSQGILFGARGFAAAQAGFTAGAVMLCIDDGLPTPSTYVGATVSPNTWYELKLVVDLSASSGRGSLFYRNLTAAQANFTADTSLQNIDLKLTPVDAKFTFSAATVLVFNGARIDDLSASSVLPNTPVITTQPVAQTVAAGGNASFSVGATGTSALAYQWRKNGVALTNGTSAGGAVVAGATASTLTLTGVQTVDAGVYTCQVSQTAGAIVSNAATLTITSATDPVVTSFVVMKQRAALQTSADAPVLASNPLSLQSRVFGTNLAGLAAPALACPVAGTVRSGAYLFDEATKYWRFSSANSYANLTGDGSLNADYADGAYVLTVAGKPVSLGVQPMATSNFPNSPRILGGTWLNGALQIDATRDYTVNFEAFANPAAGSVVWLRLVDSGLAGDCRFESSNTGTTSFTIPANTLTSAAVYSAHLVFLNATTRDTISLSGAVGVGGYASRLDFTIAATGAIPVVTSPVTASATEGTAFNYAVAATNSPTSYSLSGSLPVGLSFNTANGVISGTPTALGTYAVTLMAANAAGMSTATPLTITVAAGTTGPANNNFANRATIIGVPVSVTSSNVGATKETNEGNHAGGAGGASVWWTWTAPSSGTVFIDTAGSKVDTLLAVYTGSALTALTPVVSNDDRYGTTSGVSFEAVRDTQYHIAVDGFGGDAGTLVLNISGATSPAISTPPQSQTVAEGGTIRLMVVVTGSTPLSFEWRKNDVPVVDSSRISGATTSTLQIIGAVPADSGTYRVTVSNSAGSAPSTNAVVGVVPLGTSVAHTVQGGYHPGTSLTVANTIAYIGSPSALTWHVLLPDGWTYASSAGTLGATKPAPGATSVLDWGWTSLPANTVTFTYTLNVPLGSTGAANLVALATLTQGGVGLQMLAQPDPLVVALSTAHRADTDRNFRISLLELTRVIELFNTRKSTVRTGCYKVLAGTEDGFTADPDSAVGQTLSLYHSADANPRDGQISLFELTRVIELYNYRTGTVRTGQYRVQGNTEDGFAPGP